MVKKENYYSLLGVPRNATMEDIRQAYFDAARRLHPDKNEAPGETELFIGVQEAYEVLSNPKKRSQYDLTLPREIESLSPIDHRILFSRSNLLRLDEPQLVYAFLEFFAKEDARQPVTPPLNLCLVIDRSTSMQGTNIDVVKTTAIQILRKLKEQDYFSLVTFSDRAEVVLQAERGGDLKKMEARIQMIQCSGGTEIYSGLEAGYNEILRNVRNSQSNHIILLTDGRTYGDETKCLDLARRAAEKEVCIRGLGIGPDWNDTFLDNLTSGTGGSSMYISRPEDIQRILLEQISRISASYTEDTRLEFTLPENIELRYAFRISPESTLLPIQSPMLFGPVIKGGSLQVLMEIVVQSTGEMEEITLLDGKASMTINDQSPRKETFLLKFNRPVMNESNKDQPPIEIISALSKLTLYRLQEQAHREASSGNYEKAAENLQRLATHLLAQGERDLARTCLLEAEQLSHQNSLSQKSQKEIKYGTRALLLAGERTEL